MSIYNQEDWLERAIDSLVAQDIGFEENVELILVNDGSEDRSLEICERYKRQFPKNIQIISQPNSGLSAARNTGMQRASGALVNFMDPDDMLEPRTLSSVRAFAEANAHEGLPVFSLPLEFAGTKKGLHPKYVDLPLESSIIDLAVTPHSFLLTSAASFYPREIILQYRYDSTNIAAEDSELNLNLQRDHGFRWGYVCEPDSRYLYWQHDVAKSMIGTNQSRRAPAESIIRFLGKLVEGATEVHPSIRSAILYLLRPRVMEARESWFDSAADAREFAQRLKSLLALVPADELAQSPWVKSLQTHFTFSAASTNSDAPWRVGPGGSILDRGTPVFSAADFPVYINRVNLGERSVEIESVFYDYRVAGLDLVLVDSEGNTLQADEAADFDSALSPKNMMGPVSTTRFRRFVLELPSSEQKWHFAFLDSSTNTLLRANQVYNIGRSRFSGNDESTKASAADYWVRFTADQEFWLRLSRRRTWLYNIRSTARLAFRRRAIIPARLFASPNKTVLLINDRPMFGDDNGEALFRYIQEHRKDLAKDTWLVLAKSALSYDELKKTGQVVSPQSFKHKRLFLNTRIHFSSHLAQVLNSPWEGRERGVCADQVDQTFIWLQHGVTMNAVDRAFTRIAFDVDGLVVAAHHEAHYALRDGSFYTEDSLIRSGFPRFDQLVDTSKSEKPKTLLVSPTWRTWLTGRILADGTHAPRDGFEESDYYLRHKSLLSSPQLLEALSAANAKIEFLLHPGMAAFADLYTPFNSERVQIHLPGTVRYQEVLTRSSAMITDYSSSFFDFSYMGKPVLFDHSDVEQFRASHYQEGVFDFDADSPGPIFHDTSSLIEATTQLVLNGFEANSEYSGRLQNLFIHNDQGSSARVLKAALQIDSSRRQGRTRGVQPHADR